MPQSLPSYPSDLASAAGLARPLAIARWLCVIAGMIVVIVAIGGITRLTESGLSITQWNPVTGALPPIGNAEWQAEFAKYQATPEFRYEAGPAGMTLADFKFIFFWEWFHRLIARLIGLVFALPLVWFWLRGAIPTGYKLRLVGLLALGGLQGLFGWLMVNSGLSGSMTDVSHFWLSVHLLTALTTLAAITWTVLDMIAIHKNPAAPAARMSGSSALISLILFVQLLLGAWVAGLNAGLASDTWPLMQGRIFPEADWSHGALWAFTHDPFLLHFLHRWWAWVAFIGLAILARKARSAGDRKASIALHSAVGTQLMLGIATVMTAVDIPLAIAHQVVGALLVVSAAWCAHSAGRR